MEENCSENEFKLISLITTDLFISNDALKSESKVSCFFCDSGLTNLKGFLTYKARGRKNPKCVSERLKETSKRKPQGVSWDRSYFTETLPNFFTRPEHHRNFWIFSVGKFSPHIPLHTFWLRQRWSREDRGKAPWQGWFCWTFWIVVLLHDAPMLIIFLAPASLSLALFLSSFLDGH